jgi:hypothetical protein
MPWDKAAAHPDRERRASPSTLVARAVLGVQGTMRTKGLVKIFVGNLPGGGHRHRMRWLHDRSYWRGCIEQGSRRERRGACRLGGLRCRRGRLGPVARFDSGEVVAYQVRSRRRRRLFVFRTLEVDGALAVAVPGVRPRVQLLMQLRTAGRIRLVRSVFAYLVRTGREPSLLPDIFSTRVDAVLGGRLPAHKIIWSLTPSRAELARRAHRGPHVPVCSLMPPPEG